jgi:hypothetical protein
MSVGKSTLILSFAFLGFLVGAIIYALFNWILMNGSSVILFIPIPVLAP